jgi:Ca2+/H+ antiporter, TMEM165/GDT1 family
MGVGFLLGVLLAFALIGGLELIDRTSFALIAVSARLRALGAWVGGAAAFVTTTVIAVAVGAAVDGLLGPGRIDLVRIVGGAVLLGYAAWTLVGAHDDERPVSPELRGAIVTAFTTIFLLELGDTTMVFEIVLVPSVGWLAVLIGGALGLVTVAGWDVWLGGRIGVRLRPATLRKVVASILFVVGALTIAYGLAPAAFAPLGAA